MQYKMKSFFETSFLFANSYFTPREFPKWNSENIKIV